MSYFFNSFNFIFLALTVGGFWAKFSLKLKIMKNLPFIMWAVFIAALLVGCTTEPLYDNPINEPSALIVDQNNFTKHTGNDSFTFTGFGDMVVVKRLNSRCGLNNLQEVECEGMTDSNVFGPFRTVALMCTDWGRISKIEGQHIFDNGDVLNFYSSESGTNKNGHKWYVYMYTGGTGMFDGATGSVKVYEEAGLVSIDRGFYTNQGTGTLIRDKHLE